MRPVLILDDQENLLIDKMDLRGKSIDECIDAGAAEYIGAWEERVECKAYC